MTMLGLVNRTICRLPASRFELGKSLGRQNTDGSLDCCLAFFSWVQDVLLSALLP